MTIEIDTGRLAALKNAYTYGCRIQAWHLTGTYPEGKWEDVSTDGEPEFSCPAHLYRIHPDDRHKYLDNINTFGPAYEEGNDSDCPCCRIGGYAYMEYESYGEYVKLEDVRALLNEA